MNKMSLIILAILVSGLVTPIFAQTIVTNVSPMDKFVYDIKGYWNSNNPDLSAPEYLVRLNETAYYNVTINGLIGSNVTFMTSQAYVNGTVDNRLSTLNLASGDWDIMYTFMGIFPANLQPGDLLRPLGNESERQFYVNETINRDYGSGSRPTNVVEFTQDVELASDDSTVGTETTTFYIDKATGVMVERTTTSQFPNQEGTERWILKETNAWDASEPADTLTLPWPLLIGIIVAILVVLITLVLYNTRKKGKRRKK